MLIQVTHSYLLRYTIYLYVLIFPVGNLDKATNIHKTASILSWSPPFSLNLTNIEPDIVYCVEVYNITCGRRDLITSDCDVTEPSYTSDDLLDGYIYEYIVTPRSNVEGARNGTPSQPLRGVSDLRLSISTIIIILRVSAQILERTVQHYYGKGKV